MASRELLSFLILSHLLPFSFLSCVSEKVSLSLAYYETLCPYRSNFIANHLVKLFDEGLVDTVDLKLVPYGNARIDDNATVIWQHGPIECLLNTVEACSINVWPDQDIYFPFIDCIEVLVEEGNDGNWKSCFNQAGKDPKPVVDCYSGDMGKKIELQYASETNSLQPPLEYVPWVVVDGKPIFEDLDNFITHVCKAYKGPDLPKACTESPPEITHKGNKSEHRVTYKN